MDFTYSEEQRMLADSLRRFVDSEYTFAQRRTRSRTQGAFDRGIWNALAELGVFGLTVPSGYGGFGEGATSRLVVQLELGRALVLEPVIPSAVCASAALAKYGSPAQQDSWLAALASGSKIATLAWQERNGRHRPEAVQTVAKRVDGDYVLDGSKSLVWHGEVADAFLVSARLEASDEIAVFIVERAAAGLEVTGYPTIDGLRGADLKLKDVRVAAQARLGNDNDGLAVLAHAFDHGVAALCAEAAGAMERLIEITSEYLRTRQQFGVALASFQALQHRVADMLVQKELALSMAYVAAQALDEPDAAQRTRMLCAAKIVVAKAGRFIGQQAVQLHGGMGMTDELEVGDYFKRLATLDTLFGDSDYQMERYCAAMQDVAA